MRQWWLGCLLALAALPGAVAAQVPAGTEFRVNTYTTSGQFADAVAMDAGGNFVVVWQSTTQDAGTVGVFGQRYDAAGQLLGAEFRVNTYTTSLQGGPAVAIAPAGSFVVVWTSAGQDGDSFGIYG